MSMKYFISRRICVYAVSYTHLDVYQRQEEIMNLLDDVFRNRFHMNVDIRVTYKENEGQGSREYDEQRIQQEINAIFERRAKQMCIRDRIIIRQL